MGVGKPIFPIQTPPNIPLTMRRHWPPIPFPRTCSSGRVVDLPPQEKSNGTVHGRCEFLVFFLPFL